MGGHQTATDRQTEAVTTGGAIARRVGAEEAFENLRLLVTRNAAAVIGDGENGGFLSSLLFDGGANKRSG